MSHQRLGRLFAMPFSSCLYFYKCIIVICFQVWPCLAVLGGVDGGPRVGGRCVHRKNGRSGIILGLVCPSSNLFRVQWDDGFVDIRLCGEVYISYIALLSKAFESDVCDNIKVICC